MSWLTTTRSRLVSHLARLAMWVYPPYELRRLGPPPATSAIEDALTPTHRGKRWATAEVQQTHLSAAEMIYRGELDRKKTIEDKAANFLAGATLSSGILIALPTLLAEKTSAPLVGRVVMLAMFMAGVAYLVGAAMYAIRVRASGAYYVVNSSSLDGLALTSGDFRRKWAIQLMDMARRNQGFLLQKTNELYVAERLFLRGLQVASLAGLLLAVLVTVYPPERQQSHEHSEISSGSTAVLYDGLVRCHEMNSALNGQIAEQGFALAEVKAQLDAKLKSSQQVKKVIRAKAGNSSNQSSTGTPPSAVQLRCPALPDSSDATGELERQPSDE